MRCGSLPVTTAVTCPTVRMHPVINAQAAATASVMMDGRFTFGLGSGEALNEQVTGASWPPAAVRLDMLEEAVEVMRRLWTGDVITHHGRHYTVEHARLYTVPEEPPPVYISALGTSSAEVAGRIADGYIATAPIGQAVERFDASGGKGKPKQGGLKVCFAPTEDEGLDVVHERWPNEGLPGELSQVLRTPEHIMQASSLVQRDQLKSAVTCGPDVDAHVQAFQSYRDMSFDEIYVNQIGPNQDDFFRFYQQEVLPALRERDQATAS
nr:TIGR03557 family F420-dependent LLM class oxidoreductase [Phytoactinopolyspora halotolerans]